MSLRHILKFPKLMLGIVGSAALLGVAVIESPIALADATGCTSSGFGIKSFSSSYTCLNLESLGGAGRIITGGSASFIGAGKICNYRFKVRWYNNKGELYDTDVGPYHSGCTLGGAHFSLNHYAKWNKGQIVGGVERKEGKACTELYESGQKRDGVPCLHIF